MILPAIVLSPIKLTGLLISSNSFNGIELVLNLENTEACLRPYLTSMMKFFCENS